MQDERFPFPSLPSGWFAVAMSDELSPHTVLARRYFDRDLVVYRTASNKAVVADAWCPHMGAHLGRGGTVEGENLRCPFHGFCFDTSGQCVSTPYGGKPPKKASMGVWPTIERNGAVLAWYSATGEDPSFFIPEVPQRPEGRTYFTTWSLATHPQETTENSVDVGHLAEVHGYRDVEILEGPHTDGAHMQLKYTMRSVPFGLPGPPARATFTVDVYGLGYSQVYVEIPAFRLSALHLVLSTPKTKASIDLRGVTTLYGGRLKNLFAPLWSRAFNHELKQDFEIWQSKRYVDPPALAAGDGPIQLYRRWCRQFYVEAA